MMTERKYGGNLVQPSQPNAAVPGIPPGYGGNYNTGSPFPVQSHEQRRAELEALGAQNTGGDLDVSPRLKNKKDGTLHFWNSIMAMQPALYVNCDEHGNEDPVAWKGKTPKSWGSRGEPDLKQLHRVRMTKNGMEPAKSEAQEYKEMGLSADFLPDFSHGTVQAAVPYRGAADGA